MRRPFLMNKTTDKKSGARRASKQHPYEDLNKTPPPLDMKDLGSANLTPKTIIQLQQIIGNQAVQRLLADKPSGLVRLRTSPTVQRKPHGLDTSGSIGQYTDAAVKLWQTNPKMSLSDFTTAMMNVILQEFKNDKIPSCKVVIKPGLGYSGEFKQDDWQILIDPNSFSSTPGVKALEDLDKSEVEDVVGTFYHEARHTDQDFLVARMLAGKGNTAKEIKAKTKIPIWVAEEAIKQKLTTASPDSDLIAEADVLFDTMYGEHKELLAFIIDFSSTIQDVKNLAVNVDDKSLSDVVKKISPLMGKLDTWQKTVLTKKLDTLGKKKKKSPLDQQMSDDLTKIDAQLKTVLSTWKKIAKPTVTAVQDFGQQLDALFKIIFDAYNRVPSEADAFRVEGKVKREFESKTKTETK